MTRQSCANILNFYVASYLHAISSDDYHFQLQQEFGQKSLNLFQLAIDWEIHKASYYHPMLPGMSALDYINSYPCYLSDKYRYVGEKWRKIATLVDNANKNNIIPTIDALVDMEHNTGNVLDKVLIDYDKLRLFLSLKAHCTDIRILMPFVTDSQLVKECRKQCKKLGLDLQNFKEEFSNMIDDMWVKVSKSDRLKKNDASVLEALTNQVKRMGSDSVLSLINSNSFAWRGTFRNVRVTEEELIDSIIDSGIYEQCVINNCSVNGGAFKECTFVDCNIDGGPLVTASTMKNCQIAKSSCSTIVNTELIDTTLNSIQQISLNAALETLTQKPL
jgi:hypothetical protein